MIFQKWILLKPNNTVCWLQECVFDIAIFYKQQQQIEKKRVIIRTYTQRHTVDDNDGNGDAVTSGMSEKRE